MLVSPHGRLQQVNAIYKDGNRENDLKALDVPTLVLHGEQDELVPTPHGAKTAEYIPGAKYVTYKAGHYTREHEEQPMHSAIVAFLNEVDNN